MSVIPEVRLDVPDAETFDRLLNDALPCELRSGDPRHIFHRDIYFDTADRALDRRGARVRFRIRSDDRRFLSLRIKETGGSGVMLMSDERFDEETRESDPKDALTGEAAPARRLRAFVNPAYLEPTVELETERYRRRGVTGRLRRPQFEFRYDVVTVRGRGHVATFRELKVRRIRRSGLTLETISRTLQDRCGLRSLLVSKAERADRLLRSLESASLAKEVQESREVCVVALDRGRMALVCDPVMALPVAKGAGRESARALMRNAFGTVEGRVRLLGTADGTGERPPLEVWLAEDLPRGTAAAGFRATQWVPLDEIMARVGSPALRDPRTLAALAVAARADLLPVRPSGEYPTTVSADGTPASSAGRDTLPDLVAPELSQESLDAAHPVPDQFVNEQLSWLEFNARVLALAEDPGVPLLARLQFLAIFSSNLDEFFMVQVGTLKQAIADGASTPTADGLTPREELDAIRIRLAPLVARQERCFRKSCLPELERRSIRIRPWTSLNAEERSSLEEYFYSRVFPVLTPQAMTQAPGHPFPHIPNLRLSLAIMVRDGDSDTVHFAHTRVPDGLPRFVPLSTENHFVPIEQLVAANIQSVYPGRTVEEVHAFRITRSGDIQFDEEGAANLLQAIAEEVKRRPFGEVVRVEIDRMMPPSMRQLLERELSFEGAARHSAVTSADFVESEGLVDLGGLIELAQIPRADLQYPRFTPATPFDSERSIFDIVRAADRLVHHPYESFEETTERFIVEAADDPDVMAIKMTLYRSGRQSGIVDALTRAAGAGKEVSVFVELKARFDEERNIHWAKKLERAGIHVVTGLVRLKTHAKITLVVRREGDSVARYTHIGTGNYNASTARLYTDLGLLSGERGLGADLNALFNELTGSSGPPGDVFDHLFVAPRAMLSSFISLIEREAAHAAQGQPARIRIKLNGLADREVVGTLYAASQAGVEIDLIVRGICTLRPGVPGLSERIRVYSILGRFLEHARIYHFGNGGDDEYFIGSADWRPRNLRKRVEVVAPVRDSAACRRLDQILETELEDPLVWMMQSDGTYVRRPPAVGVDVITSQERFAALAGNDAPESDPRASAGSVAW